REQNMHNLTRPLYLTIMVLLLAACRQQPAVTATPDGAPATSSPAPTALPTTPAAAQPTDTPTPAHTPTAEATATVATATVTHTPTPSSTATPAPLLVSEEMNFELLAQEGGVVRSVAVGGNRVYLGAGPRVLALDAANPAAPQVIARSEP